TARHRHEKQRALYDSKFKTFVAASTAIGIIITGFLISGCGNDQNSVEHVIWSLAFSPNGQTLAGGVRDGTVWIGKVETKKVMKKLRGHSGDVYGVDFSNDGKQLVSCDSNGLIIVRQTNDWKVTSQWQSGEKGVWRVFFTADGKKVISQSFHEITLWDIS